MQGVSLKYSTLALKMDRSCLMDEGHWKYDVKPMMEKGPNVS